MPAGPMTDAEHVRLRALLGGRFRVEGTRR